MRPPRDRRIRRSSLGTQPTRCICVEREPRQLEMNINRETRSVQNAPALFAYTIHC